MVMWKKWTSAGLLGLALVACSHTSPSVAKPRYQLHQADGPGALFLIGGGDDSPPLLLRYIALAGGPAAPIVVLPLAGGEAEGGRARQSLEGQGATNVQVLTLDPASLAEERAAIGRAAALYFTGGDSGRLLTRIPPYLDAVKTAWQAGAVLGGTSAGAMVWGDQVVVKGESEDALAHGTAVDKGGIDIEPGLGLVPATTIDPHVAQRTRFGRLWLASTSSKTTGIGLDERTAVQLDAMAS